MIHKHKFQMMIIKMIIQIKNKILIKIMIIIKFKKFNKKIMIIRNYKYKIKLMIKSKIFNQINYKLFKKNKLLIKKMNLISNNLKKFKIRFRLYL